MPKNIQAEGGTFVDGAYAKAHGRLGDRLAYQRVCAFRVTHANFEDASTAETVVLDGLKKGDLVWYAAYDLVTAFSGGGVTAATLELGRTGDTDGFILATNVFTGASTGLAAVALANRGADLKADIATTPAVDEDRSPYLVTADTNLVCRMVTTTANTVALTAGEIVFYVVVGPNVTVVDDPYRVPIGN